jgi:hypothetical protein
MLTAVVVLHLLVYDTETGSSIPHLQARSSVPFTRTLRRD